MATTPRVYKTILSKYQRTRIAGPRFVRGEVFTLSINANGALDDDETLYSATWYTFNNVGIIFGAATVEDRQAHIGATAGWGPGTWVKVDLTTSSGRVFTQLWQIVIISAPYFQDETFPSPGPSSVTAYITPPLPPIDINIVLGNMVADGQDYTSQACSVYENAGPGLCFNQGPDSISISTAILTPYSSLTFDDGNCVQEVTGVEAGASVDVTGQFTPTIDNNTITWALEDYAGTVPFIIEITGSITVSGGIDESLVAQCYSDVPPP